MKPEKLATCHKVNLVVQQAALIVTACVLMFYALLPLVCLLGMGLFYAKLAILPGSCPSSSPFLIKKPSDTRVKKSFTGSNMLRYHSAGLVLKMKSFEIVPKASRERLVIRPVSSAYKIFEDVVDSRRSRKTVPRSRSSSPSNESVASNGTSSTTFASSIKSTFRFRRTGALKIIKIKNSEDDA